MEITVRLDAKQTAALRLRAEHEGRSTQEIARDAIRAYLARTNRRDQLDNVLDEELPAYTEALKRLGSGDLPRL